jgi:hypothetical protein
MRHFLIFLIIISTFGCKSIKKVKSIENLSSIEYQEESIIKGDSKEKILYSEDLFQQSQQKVEYTEEEESVVESYTSIVSNNGVEKIIPIKTTITKKISFKSDDSTKIDSETQENSNIETSTKAELNQNSSSDINMSFDLDKESESSEIIEELSSGIFGGWAKIIIPILVALFTAGWKIYKNKSK